jgi:hypothetical protein
LKYTNKQTKNYEFNQLRLAHVVLLLLEIQQEHDHVHLNEKIKYKNNHFIIYLHDDEEHLANDRSDWILPLELIHLIQLQHLVHQFDLNHQLKDLTLPKNKKNLLTESNQNDFHTF